MRLPLPIAQGFYIDESLPVSSQRCVNFRPHIPQTQTITTGALIGTEGISLAVDLIDINRGAWVMNDVAYEVNGNKLYAVSFSEDIDGNRTYSYTDVTGAEFIEGSAKVIMADNGTQLLIIAPDANITFNAWIYTVAGGLAQIIDSDFRGPVSHCCYMDGYFVFVQANSNVFFISDLRDGFSYNALDFASAESDPDKLIALIPFAGILYPFGSKTFEQWQNPGTTGAGFPFTKATSGNHNKGCAAPLTLTEFNGGIIFIGGGAKERPAVWFTNGGEPVKVSTPAVDILINSGGSENISLAYQVNWSLNGRNCIAFTIPNVCTIEFDATTTTWYERKSLSDSGDETPWRVSSLIPAYSVFLVGDSSTGKIGVMSEDVFTEYGNRIRSYFTTPSMDNNGLPFTVDSLELFMETGTAPISGAGSNPVIRLGVSEDAGRSFDPDISRDIGITGDYENVVSWDLLGRFPRSFTPKIICDEPIKKVIVKGWLNISA